MTLGPKGPQRHSRQVVVRRAAYRITKDGVTVAKEIELEDKFENMGAQMVREVASKTNDTAGDGTTTATVLAQAIVREGAKSAGAAGMNPMDLKRGIDLATAEAIKDLAKRSKKIKTSAEVAQGRHDLVERRQVDRQDDLRRDAEGRQRGRHHGGRGQEPSRPNSTLSRACSSTAAISRPISLPTPRRWSPNSRTS